MNMSSYDSNVAAPLLSVYAMSKAAIDELTKSMAVELAPRRVCCYFHLTDKRILNFVVVKK